MHRCNAAEIFMDAYPLEQPREGVTTYSKNLRKQHEEMLQLLDDPCPAIRVIAIKVSFCQGLPPILAKNFHNILFVV